MICNFGHRKYILKELAAEVVVILIPLKTLESF